MSVAAYPLRVLQNRLGSVPRPSFCTYLVCNRCNAGCKMCDSWQLPRGAELSPGEVRRIFSTIGRLDVVRLSGGEPFLRDDLALVAEAVLASSRPAVLHVTTNGSLPDRIERFAAEITAPRRLHIMVSFDGLEPEHDRNRGRAASFANAFATVQRLAGLRSRGVEVSVNHTVISPQSLRDHEELRRLFDEINVDVQWVLAYETSSMYGAVRRGTRSEDLLLRPGYPLHPALDARECGAFLESQLHEIGRLRARALRLGKRYYLRGLRERLRADAAPRLRPKCVALRSHIRLLPDGRVPVCQFNTETVGDLSRQPFPSVWRGEPARRARAWVDACSGCWAECEVVPNALYSGDLWRAVV
ncbi:MAG: radical SAM protein [Polyangia bacterium]